MKARTACVNLPEEYARDDWFNTYLAHPRLIRTGTEFGGFVYVRPSRSLTELSIKASVVERWVRRCARRYGIALGSEVVRVYKQPGSVSSADPLDYVGSLGVRIEVADAEA